ncbi:hypothetical protein F6453_0062 [Marinobacter nauticus]|uniref:Uncharacterized protein n=1 Tax=Marinobacter nauticus TaxID=2743 RepID=A0A833JW28_MARNT|nr:hypothetical protein F6453_0062 [Marinobacter nauticus]
MVLEALGRGASENRCEYIPVRLLSAFPGSEHFRKHPGRSPL